MNYTEIISKYKGAGLSCLPTKDDKSPDTPDTWHKEFSDSDFLDCYGIGIKCGKASNGLECFDFDAHQGDAKENLTAFINTPEVKELYEKYKFPIEKSVSGGYHVLFRCLKNEGNRKLATRIFNGKPDTFIETRGEGGYFCASPTPKYKVVNNDILNIPTITTYEREILFEVAISFNEYKKEIPLTEHERVTETSGERVGDLYNSSSEAISDMISLLQQEGWKQVSKYNWRRPEKPKGISATLGKIAPNVFFPFSSNSDPFESGRAYTPFQVLAILKFNGNFSEAAKSLVPQYGSKEVPMKVLNGHAKLDPTEIERLLERSKIDTKREVRRPPIILSIKEQSGSQFIYKRLFTLGNFSCIIGKAKSRKTYLLSLLTASIINPEANTKFESELPTNKRGVMYFDTEQGEYDCYNVIKRIETLAQVGTMRSFSLREFSPMERCAIIEHAFTLWGDETGYCVIDGIADLANAINDETEATRISTMLLRLTKQYNCHISTVIHQNKNDNFATGHLGSSIMKKSEILISVTKALGNPQLSDISCDLSRGIDFDPFCIAIDDNAMPYVTNAPKKSTKNGNPFTPQPQSIVGMIPLNELNEIQYSDDNDVPF